MKKLKSSEDRLSELPDSLIFHIFWYMPMRDVVQTTILSKRWNKLWTTAPSINLDFSKISHASEPIRNFVNRAFMFWKGPTIQKFKIGFPPLLNKRKKKIQGIDVDCWVNFVLGNRIQELYLHLGYEYQQYLVPQKLYSYPWLKVLSLMGCRIEIDGNVQWNQLKSLRIADVRVSASAINQVLCGSPQLEVFILNTKNTNENWSIRSSSLKRLSISIHADNWNDLELRIWTPNLESLEISGYIFRHCLLMDVTSLAHATLDLTFAYIGDDKKILLEEALRQIFRTIQHVERVVLSDSCVQVLGRMNKEGLFSSTSNVKFLKLNNKYVNYEQILRVVEIFPELKILSLRGISRHHFKHARKPHELDTDLPKSFLQQLRTIQITCHKGEKLMFPFIKIVLKYADNLEKMVLQGVPPSKSICSKSEKLLRMPRSSSTVEFMLFEN